MKEAEGLGLYLKVGGRLHFVLFHKFICGNSWKKGVRHHDFYSELVLRGVGHGYFYFILAGLLPPLVAPHGDGKDNIQSLANQKCFAITVRLLYSFMGGWNGVLRDYFP